ncbi:MAG: hypothetical protein QOD46_50, partial [Actinomycetota bacterium]|nr:hypothetical protein [Actinomycetota bacterium]
ASQLEDNPDHNMTETQVKYASVIRTSGNDLLTLLNSILDLAKVESGTVTAERTELVLGDLRDNLLAEFEPVARGGSLQFRVEVDRNAPHMIVTDPQRLQQIVKNLLTNAFKFTESGEVVVNIGVAEDGWSSGSESMSTAAGVLAIAVTDTGIGVPAEQQGRIFEAFAQGDGTTARVYGGTGLGLSICRELAILLGGEISVRSAAGQGSTFTLYIPLGREAVGKPSAIRPSTSTPPERSGVRAAEQVLAAYEGPARDLRRSDLITDTAFKGTTVLIVDDDFRNIFAMTALLERGDADVIAVESGPDALAVLQERPVDIVLMDIMMPIMDGYETMMAIREMDGLETLPVIAVTGKVMPGERQRCLDAGATDYVPKPVDTAELVAVIGPWLRGSAVMSGVTGTLPSPPAS